MNSVLQNMDEGYIKFNAHWQKAPPLPAAELQELDHWRNEMYRHHLIGAYPDGIGYGNISRRADAEGRFHITGSATGLRPKLRPEDYTTVTFFDIPNNAVHCRGPIIASSESMSHAVIYRHCPWVGGVIHIHHREMWERLLHQVPTTAAMATYGSPEMALSIIDLLENTDLPAAKIFVMEGHPEGVFAFGKTLAEAAAAVLKWFGMV